MAKSNKTKDFKGIKSLLGDISSEFQHQQTPERQKELTNTIMDIPLADIEVNPQQPRTDFDENALKELAHSIKQHGLIQPITVRALANKKFQIIAGERRWRASKLAKLKQIPAYIRPAKENEDLNLLEIALIENIQRQDLNAMEIAFSYQRLMEELNLSPEELGERLGKGRTTIANFVRLLKLPPKIQKGLRQSQLTMGHARAMIELNTEQQLSLFERIIKEGLSVRKVEAIARALKNLQSSGNKESKERGNNLNIHHKKLQENLSNHLDTKVHLKRNARGNGQLIISFTSDKDLNRILDNLEKYQGGD